MADLGGIDDFDPREDYEDDINKISNIVDRGNLTQAQQRYFRWAIKQALMFPNGKSKSQGNTLGVEEL